jgi:Vacuolar protein sorting-associated protein 62
LPPESDHELLHRYRPELRYDRQYDYRASAVETAVGCDGILLCREDGGVIAHTSGQPQLTLELLSDYPYGLTAESGDYLAQGPDHDGDARRMAKVFPECVYGRVVEDGGRTWLQYWFWLYNNPKNVLGIGRHEGDWEMIQLALGPDGRPAEATYAQHADGEARTASGMEFADSDEGLHPVVYVAPLSHASYFESGTHPYIGGIDHPYGDGPRLRPPVEALDQWAHWPGHWGRCARGRFLWNTGGPPSPGHQRSWASPDQFHKRMRHRAFRLWLGRALHRLGEATYPLPPSLAARRQPGRVEVDYELSSRFLRRARHLYLTATVGDDVVSSRRLRKPPPRGTLRLLLGELEPASDADVTVWATTFNFLRQRSSVAQAVAPGNSAAAVPLPDKEAR